MEELLEKMLLLIVTTVCSIWMFGPASVLIVLVGIIYTSFCYRFSNRNLCLAAHFFLWILIIKFYYFILLLPLMLYEVSLQFMKKDKQSALFFCGGVVVYAMSISVGMQSSLSQFMKRDRSFLICIILVCMVSIYLAYSFYRSQKLKAELIRTRDDGEEKRILLEQANHLIQKNSENEIDMATLHERNRIAREIHDNVGHLLTRSIVQMGALQAIYKEEPLAGQLKQVGATLDESMNQVRASVHNLHNEGFDLKEKVLELKAEFEQYQIDLEYDLSNQVSKEIKYCFLAILKEAMINIKKHSNATKVAWMLREHVGFYQLMVNDNGQVKQISETGIGIHNMETRVKEQGGTIHFSTENGFRIFITMPKSKEENHANNCSGR